jgi:FtsZ-binding cell division protein ZapB
MKKPRRVETHSELVEQSDAAIRCLRGDVKCLKYEVKRLKHIPITQPDIQQEVGLLRKDVRCLKHELRKLIQEPGVQSELVRKDLRCLKYEPKKLKFQRALAEEDMGEGIKAVVVKCPGREEDGEPKGGLEMLRLEIEELKGRVRQLEEEPDLSQVAAEFPKIAPGQLLFRTEQPVQGD